MLFWSVSQADSPLETAASVRWFRVQNHRHAPGSPVFVLLHGVGLSHRSFSRLAAALDAHGTVIAPDLPGFGQAPGSGRRLGVGEMVDMLLPRVDVETAASGSASPLVILGHSFGVQVATELVRRRPDATRALVLVSPVVDPDAWSAAGQGRRLAVDMWAEPALTNVMVARDYTRGGPLSFAAAVRSMLRYDTCNRVQDLQVPVLVLRGKRDPIAPTSWVTRLSLAAEKGTSKVVSGAAHNLVHSHAGDVSRHVMNFLTEAATNR